MYIYVYVYALFSMYICMCVLMYVCTYVHMYVSHCVSAIMLCTCVSSNVFLYWCCAVLCSFQLGIWRCVYVSENVHVCTVYCISECVCVGRCV